MRFPSIFTAVLFAASSALAAPVNTTTEDETAQIPAEAVIGYSDLEGDFDVAVLPFSNSTNNGLLFINTTIASIAAKEEGVSLEKRAWDCSVENGGCEHACNAIPGAPRCQCPAGAALQADGRSCTASATQSCNDLCEHFCVPNPDQPGSYSCMCETGYRLAADQHRCEDVDDCILEPSPCPQRCVNTQGGFECHCYPNYDLVDGECVEPVDPCFRANCEYQCQPLAQTSYLCVCAEGFAPIPHEPHRCQMFCAQTACPADCDPNTQASCECPEGYILDDGFICTDIDECENGGFCSGVCHNLPGTFECICGPDSALVRHIGTDCDSGKVDGGDSGSGEPPPSPTPGSTLTPPAVGLVHS